MNASTEGFPKERPVIWRVNANHRGACAARISQVNIGVKNCETSVGDFVKLLVRSKIRVRKAALAPEKIIAAGPMPYAMDCPVFGSN